MRINLKNIFLLQGQNLENYRDEKLKKKILATKNKKLKVFYIN